MILRYSITTLCMLVFASISIAQSQDQMQDEPVERGNQLAQNAFVSPEVRFELVLTDELIQKLKRNGELVSKVPEDVVEKFNSIKIRLKDKLPKPSAGFFQNQSSPQWIVNDNAIVFRFSDDLLSRLKHRSFLYRIPDSLRGKFEKVKLVWKGGVEQFADNLDRRLATSPFAQRPVDPLDTRRPERPVVRNQVSPFATTNAFPNAIPISNKETNKFKAELARLTQDLKETESESEKADLQDEIRDLLESEYDRHLGKQDSKLVEMEKRLKKLREQYKKQKDAKDKLVEMRMTSIISDAEGLGWPTDRRNTTVFQQPSAIAQTNQWRREIFNYQRELEDRRRFDEATSRDQVEIRRRKVGELQGKLETEKRSQLKQRNSSTQDRSPSPAPPPLSAYIIKIGDTLRISSATDPSLNQEAVSVISDGMISLPLIGQIQAAGANIATLQQQLDAKYSKYVKEPAITVQVVESTRGAGF